MREHEQPARHLFLIRPAAFAPNPDTSATNSYQANGRGSDELCLHAARELDGLAAALAREGAEPLVFDDLPGGASPDAVFPNNWVSFHQDGTVVLYPMQARNRRHERRPELVNALVDLHGFVMNRLLDLSFLEQDGRYLEGTGSLVLDRPAGVAYAARSPRTHDVALDQFAARTGYRVVRFDAGDGRGRPVYHTNVLMSIGSGYAVICLEAIHDPAQRHAVVEALTAAGHQLIPINLAQVAAFAANCLEVTSAGGPMLVLSATAVAALQPAQRRLLERRARLLPVAVPLIEHYGGGSVRCMLAEIHLPRASVPMGRNE